MPLQGLLPRTAVVALAIVAAAGAARSAEPASSPALQSLVDRSVQSALSKFRDQGLKPDELAVTVIHLGPAAGLTRASYRGDQPIYPASVIKLFYLAAAHRWLEDGRLAATPELRRALRDMIVDSSNDATHYVIDLLTGTTSGPELGEQEIREWWDKRNAVNRYFASLGYTGINASKKPWGDGPYGRETQAIRLFTPKRNQLTTDATARLLAEIATGTCITAARSGEMLDLMARDLAKAAADPDDQARFSGPALPAGAKFWSKAGWTSETRHDAVCVELPGGTRFVLVVFTLNHAQERGIIRAIVGDIASGLPALGPG